MGQARRVLRPDQMQRRLKNLAAKHGMAPEDAIRQTVVALKDLDHSRRPTPTT